MRADSKKLFKEGRKTSWGKEKECVNYIKSTRSLVRSLYWVWKKRELLRKRKMRSTEKSDNCISLGREQMRKKGAEWTFL